MTSPIELAERLESRAINVEQLDVGERLINELRQAAAYIRSSEEEKGRMREALREIADDASPWDEMNAPLAVRIAKDHTRRIEIAREALSLPMEKRG